MLSESFFTVTAAAIKEIVIANAETLPVVANANDIRAGAVVKAVWCEMWISGDSDTAQSTFNITVEKTSGAPTPMTFAQSVALTAYPNKKNILYTTQGLIGANESNAVPILRQWIAIPKGKQRFGLGDQLIMNIASITGATRGCGIFIFKEYY